MGNRKAIQIVIPTPCHESWDEMTPVDGGRHCAHCNKRVIDFTQSSDAELYKAITSAYGEICGRLLTTQINRPISIPYQPHSRLYRLAIAMGLGLIFTQSPQVLAQNRPPMVQDSLFSKKQKSNDTLSSKFTGGISGRVIDEMKQGIINATVQIFQHDTLIAGNVTDYDGNYVISPIPPGIYDALITYIGYDSVWIKGIPIDNAQTPLVLNRELRRNGTASREYRTFISGAMEPILQEIPTKRVFTKRELDHMW